MINVLISGANGRMGKKVYEACLRDNEIFAVCGVDLVDGNNGELKIYSSFSNVAEKVDVIIDFSSRANLNNVLEFCLKTGAKAILCATGMTDEDIALIKETSKKVALFRSSNMSLGINILVNLIKQASLALKGYDIEIIEKHHNKKVDSPSGTALMMSGAVKEVLPDKYEIFGREGFVGKRTENEIGVHAVRGGNIVGEHDILFIGENEVITLSHSASDRAMFAEGAIKAAKFMSKQSCGLFDMQDVIKENA
jgi:4-hydroxy-tetrahydrodipicolinate reductase